LSVAVGPLVLLCVEEVDARQEDVVEVVHLLLGNVNKCPPITQVVLKLLQLSLQTFERGMFILQMAYNGDMDFFSG
jgi:hypothetical protein